MGIYITTLELSKLKSGEIFIERNVNTKRRGPIFLIIKDTNMIVANAFIKNSFKQDGKYVIELIDFNLYNPVLYFNDLSVTKENFLIKDIGSLYINASLK